MAGYVRTLIKSQPLVPFFCHCVSSTLGYDTARLSTVCIPPSSFPSLFIYCFRPSPSCLSFYDFSRNVRRTLPVWHKVFLSVVTHRARAETFHYYPRFFHTNVSDREIPGFARVLPLSSVSRKDLSLSHVRLFCHSSISRRFLPRRSLCQLICCNYHSE